MIPAQATERDEFLAIVCADEELLQAEFAAIIGANWDEPPPSERPPSTPPPTPGDRPGLGRHAPVPHDPSTSTGGYARQRSPPPPANPPDEHDAAGEGKVIG
jgi:hypothetical protein